MTKHISLMLYLGLLFTFGCYTENTNEKTPMNRKMDLTTEKIQNCINSEEWFIYKHTNLSCSKCQNYITSLLQKNYSMVFALSAPDTNKKSLILKEMHLTDFKNQICFISKSKAILDSNLVMINFDERWDILKVKNGYPKDTVHFSDITIRVN